uniref:protein xylosyltransferase n=1 Tax=Macrostomum lignano TaxID=282301 RepID=A0A1I8FM00_9PLAT
MLLLDCRPDASALAAQAVNEADEIVLKFWTRVTWLLNPHRNPLGLGNYDANVLDAACRSPRPFRLVWPGWMPTPVCRFSRLYCPRWPTLATGSWRNRRLMNDREPPDSRWPNGSACRMDRSRQTMAAGSAPSGPRYAVDRAAQPECRVGCCASLAPSKSGRLPYARHVRTAHVGQACSGLDYCPAWPGHFLSQPATVGQVAVSARSDSVGQLTNNMPAESRPRRMLGQDLENDRVRLVYLMTLSGRGFPNVRLMRRRFPTIWGGTGLLDLMLAAFRDLLNCTDWHWDFVINLSESDFPIRPDRQLTAYLTEMRHLSFLASHSGNYSDFMRKQAIERYFVQCDNHIRQPIEGLLFDGGSDWLTLNREFVQFVISGLDNNHTIVTNIVEYLNTACYQWSLCSTPCPRTLSYAAGLPTPTSAWLIGTGSAAAGASTCRWLTGAAAVHGLPGAEAAAYASSSGSGGHGAFFARENSTNNQRVLAVDAAYAELMKQRHGGAAGREMRAKLGRPRYWLSAFTAGAPGLTPVQSAFGRLLTRLLCAELLSGTCPAGFDPDSVRAVEVTEFYLETRSLADRLDWRRCRRRRRHQRGDAARRALQPAVWHRSGQAVRIVHPKQQPHGNASSSTSAYQSVIAARFMEFEVGRQYDWKEDLFRDRLSLLAAGRAADSGLQLRYAWGPGPAVTATFLLLDPDGAIRSAFQLSVPELLLAEDSTAKEVGCTDLQAPGSLEPGVWRLLLLDEQQPLSVGSAVAESEFILNPAESAAANPDIRLAVRLLSRRYRLETVCRHSDSAAASSAACPGIVGLTDSCSLTVCIKSISFRTKSIVGYTELLLAAAYFRSFVRPLWRPRLLSNDPTMEILSAEMKQRNLAFFEQRHELAVVLLILILIMARFSCPCLRTCGPARFSSAIPMACSGHCAYACTVPFLRLTASASQACTFLLRLWAKMGEVEHAAAPLLHLATGQTQAPLLWLPCHDSCSELCQLAPRDHHVPEYMVAVAPATTARPVYTQDAAIQDLSITSSGPRPTARNIGFAYWPPSN